MVLATQAAAKEERPNVLVLCIDDLRPELACYGASYIHSPHIDALASRGVLFERAYCQQAICAPSRASMMAGQYPDSLGIYDLWSPLRRTVPDAMSLPRYFYERGYNTSSFGKVYHHHNDDRRYWSNLPDVPGDRYADPTTLGSIAERRVIAKKNKLTRLALSQATKGPAVESVDVDDGAYRDGAVVNQAVEALKRAGDEPFFMCVGLAKPHLPFAAPKRYWDLYDREQFEVPERALPDGAPSLAFTNWGELRSYTDIPKDGPLNDEQTAELKHGYAACVSYADAQVGRVLTELDRQGLRDKTTVVLWGDHGYKLGDYGLWCKHTNLELDTHVPLIISAPNLSAGVRTRALAEMVDLFPTLAMLTEGSVPDSCEGVSLLPVLQDATQATRSDALSQYPRGSKMGYSLRTDRWRYTEWILSESNRLVARELYDLRQGVIHDRNLAEDTEKEALVASLSQRLRARLKNTPAAKNAD
ncbi:Choline-sulfatase [Planctomycetes bacterium MalM25]|nr:Choline-sulfatase [Planctomycetes bacterium MalM25]